MIELEKMIKSHEGVVKQAQYIILHPEKIEEYAENNKIEKPQHWLECLTLPYELEETIEFLLLYHTIGFCYWGDPKWTITYQQNSYDGATGMAYALMKKIKENNNRINWNELSNLSIEEFKEILQGNIQIPLLEERYKSLIEVANIVKDEMKGSFYQYIKEIGTDTQLFHAIINHFPSYQDSSIWEGKEISYYKRAQLLTSDILHEKNRILKQSVEYTHLIGCADYKIPQVLRGLGMVEYTKELADKVDKKIEVKKGSKYEIEIRSSMLVIINELKKKWNNQYTAIEINDGLWLTSQKNLGLKPYHRTRTTAY